MKKRSQETQWPTGHVILASDDCHLSAHGFYIVNTLGSVFYQNDIELPAKFEE